MPSEDEVLAFAAASTGSVWAVELMLLLKRAAPRAWSKNALIRESRSSEGVVAEALKQLQAAGIVVADEAAGYRYQPVSEAIAALVEGLERIYLAKPAAVVRAIVTAPNRRLRIFSDAFKLKDPK